MCYSTTKGVASTAVHLLADRGLVDYDAPLVVRVELDAGDADEVAARCRAALKETVGVDATVEVLDRESLERSGYKAVRLVDA
jgi:CubicO group peptidase (beta-lactamase class C family)